MCSHIKSPGNLTPHGIALLYIEFISRATVLVLINPRRMRCRVTVLGLCVGVSVCLSVTVLAATYLIFKSQMKCRTVLYGVFNTCMYCMDFACACLCV